ncbi:MAG: threonylcarbamoyl-AMP synthase, partial [Rhodothermia bacterium]|nr:threonylcarbamoyl-AMP synthase [Rhodothermia bacterium]
LRRSPGLRHRHYAPRAQVVFADEVEMEPNVMASFIGLREPMHASSFALVRVCRSVEEYGYELYQFFRDSDALRVERIYCDRPSDSGLGRTIIDRIGRASRR